MASTPNASRRMPQDVAPRIAVALLDALSRVPSTVEARSGLPADRARAISRHASKRAAVAAGSLALPPGPLGWLTLLPEIVTVWRLQAQMVADIAGAYGRDATLTREHMMYCLFRHSAAQAVRDLAVRVGEQLLVHRLTQQALVNVAGKVGTRVAKQATGKAVARWLPLVGAVGVGAYAWYDTDRVARTAIELFESERAAKAVDTGGVDGAGDPTPHGHAAGAMGLDEAGARP
jgi:hypothetical protein